jgi:peptidase A4-like protein
MDVQKLPKGGTIRRFSLPPDGFKPLEAEDRELRVYGFPRRPTENPELLKRWQTAYDRKLRFIRPVFRRIDWKRRRIPGKAGLKKAHGVEQSNIWSGAVVHVRDKTVRWVASEWTVPNAYPPPDGGAPLVWYSASTWIGIDGDGSPDVLQAGCDSDVMSFFGFTWRQLMPWWEWFPEDTHWISNFPVSQGDTMSCVICVDPGSTTAAEIYMLNSTNGAHTSFAVTASNGTSLVGNCAEWIVEALEIDTSVPELASYGSVYFDGCVAGASDQTLLQAGDGNTINMIDANGKVISRAEIEDPQLVRCFYERFPSVA